MLWIPITIAAAALQTARNALQRRLTGRLSPLGATYTRFVFGLPFAAVYAAAVFLITGATPVRPPSPFLLAVLAGAVAQVLATLCLIHLFQLRNFSAGIAFSKTEIVLAAIFGFVLLGDGLSVSALVAIALATGALLLLSKETGAAGFRATLKGLIGRPALLGLATGGGFAVAAVSFRAASKSLEGLGFAAAAAETLVATLLVQTVLMSAYLLWREPGQASLVLASWRRSALPGLAGAFASAGWFTAMTLEAAALVRMLGLIEVPMSYVVTIATFREVPSRRELAGTAILVAAIVILLAGEISGP